MVDPLGPWSNQKFKVEQMQRNMILENLIVITKIQNNKKLMGKNNKTKKQNDMIKSAKKISTKYNAISEKHLKKPTPQSIHHHASKSGLQNIQFMASFYF